MPEPVTAAAGVVTWAAVSALSGILGNRADKHILDRIVDRCINHDIHTALRAAWVETGNTLFAEYRTRSAYELSQPWEKKRVDRLQEQFVWPKTLDLIFPSMDDEVVLAVANDAAQLFMASEGEFDLIAKLEELWWWDELPEQLQRIIRERLLVELTCRFINISVSRAPKARDALFFQQFIALRQAATATVTSLSDFRTEVQSRLGSH